MTDEEMRKHIDELQSDPVLVNFCVNDSYVGHMYLPCVPRVGELFLAPDNGVEGPRKMRIVQIMYMLAMKSVSVEGVPV